MAVRNRSSSYASSERHAPAAGPWARSSTGIDSSTPSVSQSTPPSARSVRKRHSFFARSTSDVPGMGMEDIDRRHQNNSTHQIIPEMDESTTTSVSSVQPRRRKTEPLDAIRNSIFGGRRKPSVSFGRESSGTTHARAPSRNNLLLNAGSRMTGEHFQSEQQFYHSLRKRTISPPYNFEHLTHTDKTHLPALETVDEKDLQREFWSASMGQKPRKHLSGIAVHDLHKKLRDDGAVRRHNRSLTALQTVSEGQNQDVRKAVAPQTKEKANAVLVEEVSLSQSDNNKILRGMHSPPDTASPPKRWSSLNAPGSRGEAPPPDPSSFYESSDSSDAESKKFPSSASTVARDQVAAAPVVSSSMSSHCEPADVAYRAKQPLPSPPQQSLASVTDKSFESTRDQTADRLSPSPANKSAPSTPIISASAPSEDKASPWSGESFHFIQPPPSITSPIDGRRPSVRSDQSWEDDVDFCYQQNAESTCDFDWVTVGPAHVSSASSEVVTSCQPVPRDTRPPSAAKSDEFAKIRYEKRHVPSPSEPTIRRPAMHSHASSVGHRGFLAARRSSQDLLGKNNPPPSTLHPTQGAPQSAVFPAVFSESAGEKGPAKAAFVDNTFQFPSINGGVRVEYLSDPESCRNSGSSKHRKSSSYGSYGSYDSASKSTTSRASRISREAGTRWSISSMSSVPDLLHSRPKSKSSLSKSVISRPLESLPQSPTSKGEQAEEDSSIVPRSARTTPVRNTFIMRRPQSPEDRAILQNAGRAVQRGRPALPTRFSPVMETPMRGMEASMEDGGWL